ncbi:MAG: hypothetical protein ORN26_00505 [Candidatus Pacebacteria bacterium]|nr:hypothetical protein [Candidatus Paceibacterota bacterium]
MIFSKKNRHFSYFFICIFLLLNILVNSFYFTSAQSTREQDMAELARLEAEAKAHQQEIVAKQQEQVSLKRDISLLDLNIKDTSTKIKITDNNIKGLSYNITDKNQKIKTISEKIEEDRKEISSLIRTLSYKEYNNVSLLANKSVSDILDNSYNQYVLQSRLYQILLDYQNNKQTLVAVKAALESDKNKQEKLKSDQTVLKRQAELNKTTKNQVLTVTKGQEAKYRTLLAQTQAQIDTIRTRLFGLRDIKSISFGQAYDYAKVAAANTGVRPALILAILQQESALGANVGSCFVTDFNTGSGVTKAGAPRNKVMNPSRDVPPFIKITSSLGLDAKSTVVSCPIPSAGG